MRAVVVALLMCLLFVKGEELCEECVWWMWESDTLGCSIKASSYNGEWLFCQCAAGTYGMTASAVGHFAWRMQPCTLCEKGTYGDTTGATACKTCSIGTSSTAVGMVSPNDCEHCAAGSYASQVGATTCTLCPTGQYQTGTGASACSSCAPKEGNNGIGNSQPCVECPTDRPVAQGGTCVALPADHYVSALAQAIACWKTCPSGKSMAAVCNTTAQAVCVPWELGVCDTACNAQGSTGCFRNGTTACLKCPMGTYSTSSMTTACTGCPSGTYNPNTGRGTVQACFECAKGTYYASQGAVACTVCGAGTYQDQTAASTCKQCPPYMSTPNNVEGVVTLNDCGLCPEERPIFNAGRCLATVDGMQYRSPIEVDAQGKPIAFEAKNCTLLCEEGHYMAEPCSASANAVCKACKACDNSSWMSAACTHQNDTVCQPCTNCTEVQYSTRKCTRSNDEMCALCNASLGDWQEGGICNVCPPGSNLTLEECERCAPNTFFNHGTGQCENCGVGNVSGGGTTRCVPLQQLPKQLRSVSMWQMSDMDIHAVATWNDETWLFASGSTLYSVAAGGLPEQILSLGESIADVIVMGTQEVMLATWEGALIVCTLYESEVGLMALPQEVLVVESDNPFKGICQLNNQSVVLLLREFDLVRVWLSISGWRIIDVNPHQNTHLSGVQPWIGENSFITWDYEKVYLHEDDHLEAHVLLVLPVDACRMDLFAWPSLQVVFCMGWDGMVHRLSASSEARFADTVQVSAHFADTVRGSFFADSVAVYVSRTSQTHVSSISRLLQPDDCACGPGTYCGGAQSSCVDAPIGTYAPGYQFSAQACPVGYAGALPGQATPQAGCAKCRAALVAAQEGSVACSPSRHASCAQQWDVVRGTCKNYAPGSGPKGRCGANTNGSTELWPGEAYYDVLTGTCSACEAYTQAFPGATFCSSEGSSGLPLLDLNNSVFNLMTNNANNTNNTNNANNANNTIIAMSISQDSDAAFLIGYNTGIILRCHVQCETIANSSRSMHILRQSDTGVLYGVPLLEEGCILQQQQQNWETLAGTCGQPGDKDALRGIDATLERVHDMVLVGGLGVVSTMQPGSCATLRAVSMNGGPTTTLLHWDVGRMPLYLQQECARSPLWLGTYEDLLFVASGASVFRLNLRTTTPGEEVWHNCTLITLEAPVQLLHVQPYTGFVLLYTTAQTLSSGLQHELANARFNASLTELRDTAQGVFTTLGNTLFYLNDSGIARMDIAPHKVLCQPGTVEVQGDRCLQVPYGYWSRNWDLQSTRPCPAGTIGRRAGAISEVECKRCEDGTYAPDVGMLACLPCATFTSADGTACVRSCANKASAQACRSCEAGTTMGHGGTCNYCKRGFYSNSSTGYACLPCPSGWSSPEGANHCVVVCADQKCGDEASQTCKDVTYDYKMLNSVILPPGLPATAVAVYAGGGVLYSDGGNLYHLVDVCKSDEGCFSVIGGDRLLVEAERDIQTLVLMEDRMEQRTRTLFYGEKTHVYKLVLRYDASGVLDLAQTRSNDAQQVVAGTGIQGCVIGNNALSSRFNYITDLAYLDGTLYICDWMCNSVRAVNVTSGNIRTVVGHDVGNRENRAGSTLLGCNGTNCARLYAPKGIALSFNHQQLYITLPEKSWGGVAVVHLAENRLQLLCTQTTSVVPSDTDEQSCLENRKCSLYKALDVLYAEMPDPVLLVSTMIGITKIDLQFTSLAQASTAVGYKCQQLAGTFFGTSEAATGDRLGVKSSTCEGGTCPVSSKLHAPVHIALNAQTGVLYVGDWDNNKVRRIYVDGRCRCTLGSTYLEATHSCYRAHAPENTQCAAKHYYSAATKVCVPCGAGDAVQLACISASSEALLYSFSPQVLQEVPHVGQDWFGEASNGKGEVRPRCIPPLCVDVDMHEIRLDCSTKYKPGSQAGGQFTTRTWINEGWEPEQRMELMPVRVLPGLWYPCIPSTSLSGARCWKTIVFFDEPPGAQSQLRLWDYYRREAHDRSAEGFTASPVNRLTVRMKIGPFARFIWAADQGMMYYEDSFPTEEPSLANYLETTTRELPVSNVAYIGWPAVFQCADGYVWVAPVADNCATCTSARKGEVVACISCLPGTYSQKRIGDMGGPYTCEPCDHGTFAPLVGAHHCQRCPLNTYASSMGSTACTACPAGTSTSNEGSHDAQQCRNCSVGTGNCSACLPGEYQSKEGQLHCEACPAGTFTNQSNQSQCVPCAPNYYQPLEGQETCHRCPAKTHTQGKQGTVRLVDCTACSTAPCQLDCAGLRCGVNRWLDIGDDWEHSGVSDRCVGCPSHLLNTDDCATSETSCMNAPKAYYFNVPTRSIGICPDGSECKWERDGCKSCDDGEWSNQTDSQGCAPTWCPQGHFCVNASMAPCAAGSYASSTGHSKCVTCVAGTFSPHEGATACIACGRGSYANAPNATQCVLCSAGWFASGTRSMTCTACNASSHEYSDEGAVNCTVCDHGQYDSNNKSCTPCGLGKYLDVITGACKFCPVPLVNDLQVLFFWFLLSFNFCFLNFCFLNLCSLNLR